MLEIWAQITFWKCSHAGITYDQVRDRSAEHHITEQWRVGIRRVGTHALGIKAMLNDWHDGVKCEIHMGCDSSAARGMSAPGRMFESAQCPDM